MTIRNKCPKKFFLALAAALTLAAPATPRADVALNDCGGMTEFTWIPGVSTFPDTNTWVYQAAFIIEPGVQTILRGRKPAARFWSFAAENQSRAEIGTIYDSQIQLGTDGSYTVVVQNDCTNTPNCLPAPNVGVQPAALPYGGYQNGSVPGAPGLIYYRLYVPEGSETGSVTLPTVTYQTPSGTPVVNPILPDGTCTQMADMLARPFRPGGQVAEATANTPVCTPGTPVGSVQPSASRGGASGEAQLEQLEALGAPANATNVVREVRSGSGTGATSANAYESVLYSMNFGNVVLSAKAPTYRCQHPNPLNPLCVTDGSQQVRYYSLCTTQDSRTVDCIRDENLALNPDGSTFTAIIAPSCPQLGYANCLRSGVSGLGGVAGAPFLLYRNTLPNAAFANLYGPTNCPNLSSVFCGPYGLQPQYVKRTCP